MARRKKRSGTALDWQEAPDIQERVDRMVFSLKPQWLNKGKIHCFRSTNSSSRAYARIWGLSKIWQIALSQKPSYVIEVLSEKFDRLKVKEQEEVLLHELAHIPKNFSGSLLPHVRKRGKRNFNDRVRQLINQYKKDIKLRE
ncbi:metallopeptidase [Candidatus Woesebacteria bacterium]|nr:metallopeptidase [Candidatus Woesebacteria bacterium]